MAVPLKRLTASDCSPHAVSENERGPEKDTELAESSAGASDAGIWRPSSSSDFAHELPSCSPHHPVEQDLGSAEPKSSRSTWSKEPNSSTGIPNKSAPSLQSSFDSANTRGYSRATKGKRSRVVRTSNRNQGEGAELRTANHCASCRGFHKECHRPDKPTPKADAGQPSVPIKSSNKFITTMEGIDCAEDWMVAIGTCVFEGRQSTELKISLLVPCDVRGFMKTQYDGSNKSLGRVVTLSGTATCGQATTCRDYIYSNWPLRGLWLLDILQSSFEGYGKTTEDHNSDLQVDKVAITIGSAISVNFVGSKKAAIDVLQLLVWFGAAFQVSSTNRLQYSQPKLKILDKSCSFTVDYDKLPVSEESCWFSLFRNAVIAQGFPVPQRSNSERGLELPIELMAMLGGGRHAVDFEGGLVIKGHSIAFVPVEQYGDTVQWHMINNSDGTRLRYSDLRIYQSLQEEVDFESIKTKRAILGWSQVAQSLLGTAGLDYEGIHWTEAQEAGRSTILSGGSFGFQSNLIGQLNFALGAKDGRLLSFQTGPLEKIIDLAQKTPVALYDHHERRAWLVPALEVILHVIHTRSRLNLYKLDEAKTNISYSDETAKISDHAAKRALMASKDQQLYECTAPGEKAYCVRDAVLDIWSLLERMMERDAMITSTPGKAVQGTWQDKLYGWEFRALVEDKTSFRRKEQVLEKTSGGWVDLVEDTDTIVLFGNGFQEVIKPVPSCSAWGILPKGKDYLAVGCPMLETLYNEAGSRLSHRFLTSRHLQWHQGATLFERCENISGCTCDRLQQLVYESRFTFGRVSPPDKLPKNGCVIFGRAHHPMLPAKRTYAKQQNSCSIPDGPLLEFDSLNGRQKESSSRRSSLLCIRRTSVETSRNLRSDLENKDSSKAGSVAPNNKDPLNQDTSCKTALNNLLDNQCDCKICSADAPGSIGC